LAYRTPGVTVDGARALPGAAGNCDKGEARDALYALWIA
jgi:hypothetical protein